MIQGFIQDFLVGGGEEVCGSLPQCHTRAHSTHTLVYIQARGVWGHAPQENFCF